MICAKYLVIWYLRSDAIVIVVITLLSISGYNCASYLCRINWLSLKSLQGGRRAPNVLVQLHGIPLLRPKTMKRGWRRIASERPVLPFVDDSSHHLRNRGRWTSEHSAISLFPDRPGNQQREGVLHNELEENMFDRAREARFIFSSSW